MNKPGGYSLEAIQYWVRSESKFEGKKAKLADELTSEAMQWWSTRPYGDGGFSSRGSAHRSLKRHLRTCAKQRYGFVQAFFLMLFINLVVRIVSQMVMDWLFGDEVQQQAVHENRHIYFVNPIGPAE